MAIRYLNVKNSNGVETIDQLDSEDFNSYREFIDEVKRLINEYRAANSCFSGVYTSQRCSKDWK